MGWAGAAPDFLCPIRSSFQHGVEAAAVVVRVLIVKRMAAVLMALAATSACTTELAGRPTGIEGARPVEIRPRDASHKGLNPCQLLTAEQLAQFGLTAGERGVSPVDAWNGVPECRYMHPTKYVFYRVILDQFYGVDYWPNLLVDRYESRLLKVSEFPAVQYYDKHTSGEGCGVAVGVADKQQLNITFKPHLNKDFTQDQMCEEARKMAEQALASLLKLR
jgi:hypothetical protein